MFKKMMLICTLVIATAGTANAGSLLELGLKVISGGVEAMTKVNEVESKTGVKSSSMWEGAKNLVGGMFGGNKKEGEASAPTVTETLTNIANEALETKLQEEVGKTALGAAVINNTIASPAQDAAFIDAVNKGIESAQDPKMQREVEQSVRAAERNSGLGILNMFGN